VLDAYVVHARSLWLVTPRDRARWACLSSTAPTARQSATGGDSGARVPLHNAGESRLPARTVVRGCGSRSASDCDGARMVGQPVRERMPRVSHETQERTMSENHESSDHWPRPSTSDNSETTTRYCALQDGWPSPRGPRAGGLGGRPRPRGGVALRARVSWRRS
jgi:hypothetical protein